MTAWPLLWLVRLLGAPVGDVGGVEQAADRAGQCSGRGDRAGSTVGPTSRPRGLAVAGLIADCRGRVGRVWWSACDGGLPPPVEYEKIATIQPEAA